MFPPQSMRPGGRATRAGRLAARALALIAMATIVACGGGSGEDTPDGGDGDAGSNPNRVFGTFTVTWVAESSVRKLPVDLTEVTVEAIMPDGERITGVGEVNGDFEVLDVPEGPYTLRVGPRYFITDERRIELSIALLGREDADRVDTHTPVTLSLTNMSPWADGDTIEMFSPSGGFAYVDALGPLSGEPTVGETTYSGVVDALLAQSSGEADSDKGDVMYVTQVGSRIENGSEIREVLSGGVITSPFEIRSGDPGSMSSGLEPVTPDRQLDINWNAPAYDAAMSDVGPSAPSQITARARLVATPTDPDHGAIAAFPTLASATITGGDIVSLTASFGSPFPSHWDELEIDELTAVVELEPGGALAVVRAGAVTLPGRLSNDASPMITPPTTVTIDGQSGSGPLTGVGETPTIAWSAPDVGAADGYEIDLIELTPETRLVASLYTIETSVSLPSGLLEDGATYHLMVRSRSTPNVELALEPLAKTAPSAFAEFATAPFSR